jgi:hypothetical protein
MKSCELNNSCEYVVATFDMTEGGSDYKNIEIEFKEIGLIKTLDRKSAPHNTFIYKGNGHEIKKVMQDAKSILDRYNNVSRSLISHSKKIDISEK